MNIDSNANLKVSATWGCELVGSPRQNGGNIRCTLFLRPSHEVIQDRQIWARPRVNMMLLKCELFPYSLSTDAASASEFPSV